MLSRIILFIGVASLAASYYFFFFARHIFYGSLTALITLGSTLTYAIMASGQRMKDQE